MKAKTVVGLGLATLDILTRTPRLPNSNDCFAIDQIEMQGGGPVATALVAISRLGGQCAYLGPGAPDDMGRQITAELERYGVDISHLTRRNQGVSSVSVILVEQSQGQRAILFQKGTAPELQPQEIPTQLVASASALHLDGFFVPAALQAAQIARQHGVLVSFDGGAGERLPGMDELLPMVDLLVVARQFAFQATDLSDLLAAGPALLKKYKPRQVVITDGENGCWYWDQQCRLHQPAFSVKVMDTTGAGDTFHGAYLYACLQAHWTPKFRLKFASAVAALKCTRLGGRQGIPDLQQTLAFLSDRGETQE
jgi:sulfofructose kinase